MLEDRHIQLRLEDATEEENKPLMPYDLILRTNDEGTAYTSFDIFNYDKQTPIATITFRGDAWTYSD
jgi:hypothetical protein